MADVSILVPIYNVERYLKHCLVSLFEQTHQSIEYVFVNDASTDNSMTILYQTIDEYPHKRNSIKIINHEKNRGLAAARRTAIENSSSPYLLHVDSDDYIDIDMVSKMYNEVLVNNADLVISDIVMEFPNKKSKICTGYVDDKQKYLTMLLTRKMPFNIWGKLIKRSIVVCNQIYAVEGVNQGEDYQVFPRIFYYAQNIRHVDSIYYYNKINQSSYTNTISSKGLLEVIQSQKILNNFFYEKIDQNLIDESCIYTQLSLLSVANYKDYSILNAEFKEINYRKFDLKYSHRFVLFLLRHNFYKLTYCIIYVFQYLFR